jgi:molecular chaperone DnaJ
MFQTTRACDDCKGTGKKIKTPCSNCSGKGYIRITKKLEVSIPAGIDDGQRVAIRSMGNDGRNGGPAGDLIVAVTVRPHEIFERDGYDLYCDVPVTYAEATLGATIKVPTLEGTVEYDIPEGTQSGTMFTIRGKGIVRPNKSSSKGDLKFRVMVEIPTGLNSKQKELLREFADSCKETNYKSKKKFSDFFKKK